MGREIKFRGQSVVSGEWVYGSYVKTNHCDSGAVIVGDSGFGHTEVKPETVGQCTGLKDRNGVEIYEGDVVMCYPDDFELSYLKVVEWDKEQPSLGITTNRRSGATLCKSNESILWVVGNIHQNPE